MTTQITDADFIDLKIDLDSAEIWNDVRVLIPSHTYTLELQGETWVKIPDDLSERSADGESIVKYGRRTKILNKHVINKSFGEEYCASEVAKYKDPCHKIDLALKIKSDASITLALMLATKLSAQVSYLHSDTGLNDTGIINHLELDIDLDRMPRLKMTIEEVRSLDLLDWFIIGTDVVGSATNVIG